MPALNVSNKQAKPAMATQYTSNPHPHSQTHFQPPTSSYPRSPPSAPLTTQPRQRPTTPPAIAFLLLLLHPPPLPTLRAQQSLHPVVRHDHASIVRTLLTPPRMSATVVATSSANSTSVFQALLDAGWDINASLGHIGDALSLAVGTDKVPLVQWHLAHGADPNANLRGETYTALELGAIHASTETLDLLLDHDARIQNTSALKLAAHYGRVEVVAFLLDRGAAVDEIPDNENVYEAEREKGLGNALHTAAREGKDGVVALLLRRGADPEVKDSLGRLALELARSGGHTSVVDMLEGRSC